MRWLDSITNPMHMNLSKHWDVVKDRETWNVAVHGVAKSSLEKTLMLGKIEGRKRREQQRMR